MIDAFQGALRRLTGLTMVMLFTILPSANSTPRPDSAGLISNLSTTIIEDLGIAFRDAIGFYSAPLSFGVEDWNRIAVGTGAFGIVMAMDEPLNRLLIGNPHQGFLAEPLEWSREWGRLRTMQYASIGMYVGGLVSGSDEVRVTGRLMGEVLFLAGVPAIIVQYGLGRSRPRDGVGAHRYNFFEWSNEHQSLPSGHTTVAVAISTVLAKRIDRLWVSVPLYAFAGCTALSLVWGNEHWPSDVLLGSVLGYLAGSFVVSREEGRAAGGAGGRKSGVDSSRFTFGFGRGGVSMKYYFH